MIKDFPKRRSFPCVKISMDSIFNIRQNCAAAVGKASLIIISLWRALPSGKLFWDKSQQGTDPRSRNQQEKPIAAATYLEGCQCTWKGEAICRTVQTIFDKVVIFFSEMRNPWQARVKHFTAGGNMSRKRSKHTGNISICCSSFLLPCPSACCEKVAGKISLLCALVGWMPDRN